MHEHVFILSTEIIAQLSRRLGRRGQTGSRRDRPAQRAQGPRRGHHRRPHRDRPGPLHSPHRPGRRATDLNIVVATGIYTYNDVPMYFHFSGPGTLLGGPETMTDMFVRDITEGIAGTGIKAAILKCATDEPGVTPGVERVLRAVAQAHRQTGVPISTHTHAPTRRGLEQQAHLRRGGRRPDPRGHRPLRRHHRHRLPGGADRATAPTSAWTASGSTPS